MRFIVKAENTKARHFKYATSAIAYRRGLLNTGNKGVMLGDKITGRRFFSI